MVFNKVGPVAKAFPTLVRPFSGVSLLMMSNGRRLANFSYIWCTYKVFLQCEFYHAEQGGCCGSRLFHICSTHRPFGSVNLLVMNYGITLANSFSALHALIMSVSRVDFRMLFQFRNVTKGLPTLLIHRGCFSSVNFWVINNG